MSRAHRTRLTLLAALTVLYTALVTVQLTATPTPAEAETTTDSNPWTYTMSADAPGMRIYGSTGGDNRVFETFDHLAQPIFGVNEAGGAWVADDEFRVFDGGDIYHGQITISPFWPRTEVCVRNGQLWVGGPSGQIWRCADLDGGEWNGGWWPVA